MDFCNKLQVLRKQAGLTQDELAVKIGVSRQAISKWESGNAYPDLKNIQTLCAFFSVSADTLLHPKYDAAEPSHESFVFNESELGNNIKRTRTARGVTQEEFAEQMKVSRQSVSKLENGSVIPKTEIIIEMLYFLQAELSELLPPVVQEVPEEWEEAHEDTAAEDAQAPTPKEKKRLSPLFLIIPASLLLISALVMGVILFSPFLGAEPLHRSFAELFFEPSQALSFSERMEREGAELTLGTGEDAFTLKLYAGEEHIGIGGLSGEEVLLLPRRGAAEALAGSVFHPNSGTQFALENEVYDRLTYALRMLDESEQEEFEKTLEAILRECEKTARVKESFSFAEGRFALKKTVSYIIDKDAMLVLFDAIAAEAKKNPSFDEMYGFDDELKWLYPDIFSSTLSETLARRKMTFEKTVETADIVLTFTVAEGRIESLSFSSVIADKDKTVSTASLELKCTYGELPALELSTASSGKVDGEFVSTVNKYTYTKENREDGVRFTLLTESTQEFGGDSGSQAYTVKENYILHYNPDTREYIALQSVPELETNVTATGKWGMDAEAGKLDFSIDRIQVDGEILMENEGLAVSVKTLGDVLFPEGKSLFSLTAAEMRDVYKRLPAKHLEAICEALTGEGFTYSKEGWLVPFGAVEAAYGYGEKFLEYHNAQIEEIKKFDTKKIFVYNEKYGIYVLITRSGGTITDIRYVYELTGDTLSGYHGVELEGEKLNVHNIEFVKTVEPTCTSQGAEIYACTECKKSYSVMTEPSGCKSITESKEVMWDDGKTYTGKVQKCTVCGMVWDISLESDAGVAMRAYFERLADGTYILGDYVKQDGIFSLPQELTEGMTISKMRVSMRSSSRLIRIPEGIKTIPADSFGYNGTLQTLILPSTVTKIEEGAFADAPLLRTIYYCGTEEQWKNVDLGTYAEKWKDAEIIFAPEGVSALTASQSYY
ncbi:MAG: helix-turn-helix domain-containing protein, partial [Clostridia bacterium]|nr:helix-turn-helix domain-containing protein [Clostridia bacterium]